MRAIQVAGYVYPAAFAWLSPKVRDLVVVAGADLRLSLALHVPKTILQR